MTEHREPLERIADALERIAALMENAAAMRAEGQAAQAAAQAEADEAWAQDALDKAAAARPAMRGVAAGMKRAEEKRNR